MIDFYLMHYKTTHFDYQIENIKRYVKDKKINIYVTIDSDNKEEYNSMLNKVNEIGVTPIMMPFPRLTERPLPGFHIASSEFGLACNYVYDNYIKNSKNISVMIENDVFFIKDFIVSDYCKDYQVCGNIRVNYNYLPKRLHHFWPGFIIFNKTMEDRDKFGLRHLALEGISTDSGAESNTWINLHKDSIRHIKYSGESESYSPFTYTYNEGRNITIDTIPDSLRKGYINEYAVVIHDDFLIHLEGIGKSLKTNKIEWLKTVLN